MSAEGHVDATSGWLLVNTRILVGCVGIVACYAWLFSLVGTQTAAACDAAGAMASGGHVLVIAGVIVALLCVWAFSDFFSQHRLVQYACALVCAVVGCAGLLACGESQGVTWAACALSGAGFGLLYPLYGEYICMFFSGYIEPYVQGIFAAAGFICCGQFFARDVFGMLFVVLLALVAFAAYGFELASFDLAHAPSVPKEQSDKRNKIVWRSYLATVTSGMAIGYALGCILSTYEAGSPVYLAGAAAVMLTCAASLFDVMKTHVLNETRTMRLFLPLSALVVFPLIFVPASARFVFVLLLCAGALVPTTCSISAACRHIIMCDLSAIRAFSFGRLMTFVGMLGGMLLALVGFSELARGALGELSEAVSVVAFMLLVIFSASFVMTEDNYPSSDRFHVQSSKEGEEGLVMDPGMPIRKIASAVPKDDRQGGSAPAAPVDLFGAKCDVVAEKTGLSRRQREVLEMLARGRNAEYVAERLVVSPHTAKAHIYNIYQKTGVHSRQELMDLVENAEVDVDRPAE